MVSHDDRVRYWTGLFSGQKLSGLSVPEFCRDRGVSVHSYRGWRGRLNWEASSDGTWVTPLYCAGTTMDSGSIVGAHEAVSVREVVWQFTLKNKDDRTCVANRHIMYNTVMVNEGL